MIRRGEAALRRHMAEVHPPDNRRIQPIEDEFAAAPQLPGEDELNEVLNRYWNSIQTRHRIRPVVDIVNIRMWNGDGDGDGTVVQEEVWPRLEHAWQGITVRAKVNCSVGCVLQHRVSGEIRYFHSSENNASLFARPRMISTMEDLRRMLGDVFDVDLDEEAQRRRPNTAWRLRLLTNLTFYVWKMDGAPRVGCQTPSLPSHILDNRALLAMDKRNGVPYNDQLCFFRCLAVSLDCRCPPSKRCACRGASVTSRRTIQLYSQYAHSHSAPANPLQFKGVRFEDLVLLEKEFGLRIVVFELREDGDSLIRWASQRRRGHHLYLNIYDDAHFSLVKDVKSFTRAFVCPECERRYTRYSVLRRHHCQKAEVMRRRFPGGVFAPSPTVFDDMSEFPGICIQRAFYPYRMTFDMECMLVKEGLPSPLAKLTYDSRHEPLSLSLASNVPGFERAECFVRQRGEETVQSLVDSFVERVLECAEKASRLMRERYRTEIGAAERILEQLERREEENARQRRAERRRRQRADEVSTDEEEAEEAEEEEEGTAQTCDGNTGRRRRGRGGRRCYRLRRALERFYRWLDVVPILGFNSQRYDINVIKPYLMRSLIARDNETSFVVKRQNQMTCIETANIRFLDVCNFIAPGFSYDKYLKAFDCSFSKGFFPYEWMDSLDKLEHRSLPDRAAFYSHLRGEAISTEDYAYCQRVWESERMNTFKDFLIWYNNLDVAPMLEALEKQCRVYQAKGIDMLKDAITLPGLAVRWMFAESGRVTRIHPGVTSDSPRLFREIRHCLPVQLIDEANNDLYDLIKSNLVGGPSIIFHRFHQRGMTKIREAQYASSARPCDLVYGIDANSLYLHCLMQEMPTGSPRRIVKHEANNLYECAVQRGSKSAHGWLEWESRQRGVHIRHQHNGGEVRVGDRNLPVDGFQAESSTIYQFHGCFWHGHDCARDSGPEKGTNVVRGMTAEELLLETREKDNYMRSLGYRVVTMWECEWRSQVREDSEKRRFLAIFFRSLYPARPPASFDQYVRRIQDGSFYGLVECDIVVPEELREKFSEMSPIFKNTHVGRQQLGPEMLEIAQRRGYLPRASRMLIGSLRGDRILLLSTLAKWYLDHGLVITEIYQLVEYHPRALFKTFGESVCNARREGDVDPSKKILADMCKLIGNSCYGKTITNKDKHRETIYLEGHQEASNLISASNFCSLDELTTDGLYEGSLFKRSVRCFTLFIAFSVLTLVCFL